MDSKLLANITVTPLQRISTGGGDVLKVLMSNEESFKGFGEAYFSEVQSGAIKAWKCHNRMTLNLIVPKGNVKFVFCEENQDAFEFRVVEIGDKNYSRITVKPGLWFGFKGVDEDTSIVLNIADILHDPNETDRKKLEEIKYNW